jgi:hypothetical protein
MFLIQNEAELRGFFRELDQPEVILSEELKFPLKVRDYLHWLEPSQCRVYLVFKDPSFKAPLGLVFRRDQTMGPSVAAMCEWCHAVRSGNEIGILTATCDSKKRIGVSLCRDLSPGPNAKGDRKNGEFLATRVGVDRAAGSHFELRRTLR